MDQSLDSTIFNLNKRKSEPCVHAYMKIFDGLKEHLFTAENYRYAHMLTVCSGNPPFDRYLATSYLQFLCFNRIKYHYLEFELSFQVMDPIQHLPIREEEDLTAPQGNWQNISMNMEIKDRSLLKIWHIKCYLGGQINIDLSVQNYNNCKSSFKIKDGPAAVHEGLVCINQLLHRNETTDRTGSFGYQATFQASVIYHISEAIPYEKELFMYGFVRLPYHVINMTMHSSADSVEFKITNVKKSIFYERWRIFSINPVEIEFRKVHSFNGYYASCRYGGFVIWEESAEPIEEDLSETSLQYGPYCTRFGAEPLVNDIQKFQLRRNRTSISAYAYEGFFNIDITVRLRITNCSGITNICDICSRYIR